MMPPCAFISRRSLRQRGASSHFARKGPCLIPEFTDKRCQLAHKMASHLQTQARRRASAWTPQEADITTIEHKISFGSDSDLGPRNRHVRFAPIASKLRTSRESVSCHKRKSAPLFNHLVGAARALAS